MATLGQRLIDKTKKIREQGIKIKKLELDLKQSQDLYNVLKTDHDEVSKENEDLRNRFIKGCMWYIEDSNGAMLDYGVIPEISQVTYVQDVPKEVKTNYYRNNEVIRFVSINNRQVEIDETKYKKYIGGIY